MLSISTGMAFLSFWICPKNLFILKEDKYTTQLGHYKMFIWTGAGQHKTGKIFTLKTEFAVRNPS